jgi:hypothetical protein
MPNLRLIDIAYMPYITSKLLVYLIKSETLPNLNVFRMTFKFGKLINDEVMIAMTHSKKFLDLEYINFNSAKIS